MLKTWIEHIKTEPDHYGAEYWKYHTSNNMLELLVKKEYIQQENDYREAIISIGKVLQALRQKLNSEGLQHHIQSFPNLDDSGLIAAIRIFTSRLSTSEFTPPQKTTTDPGLLMTALKKCAEANQLTLQKMKQNNLPEVVIPSPAKKYIWYALCADHDNPFTWLRVGYWQEYLHYLKQKSTFRIIVVTDSVISTNRFILNGAAGNKRVQLLVGVPKEEIHSH